MTTQVYSLSISARLTLDMHSLNNEGSEGNQLQTRMVDIVAADGRLYSVNAISGDMLKHIQAEHFHHVAQGRQDLPLCSACRVFDANRISADPEYQSQIEGRRGAETLFSGWVFAKFPDFSRLHGAEEPDLSFELRDVKAPEYSVIQAARDPGEP